MRTFKEFPETSKCKICGTNENKECVLIPIDGTNEGNNCEATPVHTDCIKEGNIRYSKEYDMFYQMGFKE